MKNYILLVEDDEMLCEIIQEMLELSGFNLFIANELDDAVRIFSDNYQAIKIAIFDMNLVEHTGIEVYEALKKINPEFVSILSSGMVTDEELSKYSNMGFDEIVKKPYNFSELIEVLNKYSV